MSSNGYRSSQTVYIEALISSKDELTKKLENEPNHLRKAKIQKQIDRIQTQIESSINKLPAERIIMKQPTIEVEYGNTI